VCLRHKKNVKGQFEYPSLFCETIRLRKKGKRKRRNLLGLVLKVEENGGREGHKYFYTVVFYNIQLQKCKIAIISGYSIQQSQQ